MFAGKLQTNLQISFFSFDQKAEVTSVCLCRVNLFLPLPFCLTSHKNPRLGFIRTAALGNFDRRPRPQAIKQPVSRVNVRGLPTGGIKEKKCSFISKRDTVLPNTPGTCVSVVPGRFPTPLQRCVNLHPTRAQSSCPKASPTRTNWWQAAHLLGAVMNGLCRDCVNKYKDSQGHSCINNDSKRCLPFVPLTGCRHGSGSLLCGESSVNNRRGVH